MTGTELLPVLTILLAVGGFPLIAAGVVTKRRSLLLAGVLAWLFIPALLFFIFWNSAALNA